MTTQDYYCSDCAFYTKNYCELKDSLTRGNYLACKDYEKA